MTNTEIMVADAEYWAGTMSAGELVEFFGKENIGRIQLLEREYGINFNAEEEQKPLQSFEHRSWFSLLIAAAEDDPLTMREQMEAAWPFPVVHGSIPG